MIQTILSEWGRELQRIQMLTYLPGLVTQPGKKGSLIEMGQKIGIRPRTDRSLTQAGVGFVQPGGCYWWTEGISGSMGVQTITWCH